MTHLLKMYNFGITSTARINFNGLIQPALKNPNINIAGVYSRTLESLKNYQKVFNIKKLYHSYDAMLADPEIHCIYVSTPNKFHFDQTYAAIRAGKHVLCEKPFCYRVEQIDILDKAAREINVFAMDAIHYCYYPHVHQLIEKIKTGYLGRITDMDLVLTFPPPLKDDIRLSAHLKGGVWLHMGCYFMHFVASLFSNIERLKFSEVHFSSGGADTFCKGELYADETHITFLLSLEDQRIYSATKIKGEAGFIDAKHVFTPTTFYTFNPYKNVMQVTDHQGPWGLGDIKKTTYDCQLNEFTKKLQDGAVGINAKRAAYKLLECGDKQIEKWRKGWDSNPRRA